MSSPRAWLRLVLQGDGNLVLYRTQTRQPLWASNTVGQPVARVIMQGDGNLVAYTAAGVPVWASVTAGSVSPPDSAVIGVCRRPVSRIAEISSRPR